MALSSRLTCDSLRFCSDVQPKTGRVLSGLRVLSLVGLSQSLLSWTCMRDEEDSCSQSSFLQRHQSLKDIPLRPKLHSTLHASQLVSNPAITTNCHWQKIINWPLYSPSRVFIFPVWTDTGAFGKELLFTLPNALLFCLAYQLRKILALRP